MTDRSGYGHSDYLSSVGSVEAMIAALSAGNRSAWSVPAPAAPVEAGCDWAAVAPESWSAPRAEHARPAAVEQRELPEAVEHAPVADTLQGEPERLRGRVDAVDGLRGLAIAGVVAHHLGWLRGGFLGVDLFFVISGFVITRMLVLRAESGQPVTVGWFWRRRFRRLFPAFALVVGCVLIWASRTPDADLLRGQTWGEAWSGFAFGNNWYDIFANLGYWSIPLSRTPLNHLWSLSIEEQFYVVWILAFVLLARRGRRLGRLAVLAGAGVAASATAQFHLYSTSGWSRAYLGTDTRAGALLLGALAAIGLAKLPGVTDRRTRALFGRIGVWAASAGLGWLSYAWTQAGVSTPWLYHGGLLACGLASVALILAACTPGRFARVLAAAPVLGLGRCSYSLYLCHVPVIVLVNERDTGLHPVGLTALRMFLIAVFTTVIYRLVERPIHRGTLRLPRLVTMCTAGVAAVCSWALVAPTALADLAFANQQPAVSPAAPAAPKAPSRAFTASEVKSQTVLVVGDSWGIRTFAAIAEMPEPKPGGVIGLAVASCGIADPVAELLYSGRRYTPDGTCLDWRARWTRAITRQHPTIAVLQLGNWDQAPQQFTAGGPFLTDCDATFQARYRSHLDEAIAILSAGGTNVFISSVEDNAGSLRSKSDCMNAMFRAAVARHPGGKVHLLDLEGYLCPDHRCRPTIEAAPTHDETGHLSPAVLPAVNRWIWQQLGAALGSEVTGAQPWSGATAPVSSTVRLALPDAGLLAGRAKPPAVPLWHGVDVLQELPGGPSLAPLRNALAGSADAAGYRIKKEGAALAIFRWPTDVAADAAAQTLGRLLTAAGYAVKADGYDLQYYTKGTGKDAFTVAFLRSLGCITIAVQHGVPADQSIARARQALTETADELKSHMF